MGEEVLSSDACTIFGAALIPISWHMGCDRRLEQTPLGYSQPWMRAYPTVALSLAIPELGTDSRPPVWRPFISFNS